MHVDQAKEVDVLADSNVHKFDPIDVLHTAHEENNDDILWPMIETSSKLLNHKDWVYMPIAPIRSTILLDLIMAMHIQLKKILVKPI